MVKALAKEKPFITPAPRPVWKTHMDISVAFFRVGILGFGGGPSAIPLVHQETVNKYKWMNEEEFSDTLAIANAMPGPIATKLAGYIGYRVSGVVGAIVALVACIAPTAFLMIFLLQLLQAYKNVPWVQHMSASVVPVVAVMLATLTWDFVKKSRDTLGWHKALIVLLGSFLLIELMNIHPAIIILLLLILVFLPFKKRRR